MSDNRLIFRCFASGSSGNCYYLGTAQHGILIDAGISARSIRTYLRSMNLDFPAIHGVLITHDHADHIRNVGALGERFHIPIYTNALIHEGINRNYGVREKLRTCKQFIQTGVPFTIDELKINSFHVSHDSSDCIGYVIDYQDIRFMIATDVGCPNAEMEQYIRSANYVVIEANHDEDMLLHGAYPSYLKQRILSERGHQSNTTCARIVASNWHEGLRSVFLCHLSHENNNPEVAYHTVAEALEQKGVQIGQQTNIYTLEQYTPSPVFALV